MFDTDESPVEEEYSSSDEFEENYAFTEDWSHMKSDFTKQFQNVSGMRKQPNSQQRSSTSQRLTVNDKSLSHQFSSKISLGEYQSRPVLFGSGVSKKMDVDRSRFKDKADRATVEQVLDPRTRMIIFKLLSQGLIAEVNGCISTGKEANVYHATKPDGDHLAIKIYKTSILIFKDRDKYVSGEYRFRNGYCKSNPRKMVRTWAEKEFRNLNRLFKGGIPSPEPILLKSHVLVMSFLGEDGWPAPRLKDADISSSKACELYMQLVRQLHTLYNQCKLVHADLSEYNLLYHQGDAYWIDVSQSVEHDHPHALEFLRKDCMNINQFFIKKNVSVLTTQELFEFITDPSITESNVEHCIQILIDKAMNRSNSDFTNQEKIDAEVFMKAFIPSSLEEVPNPERDIRRATSGSDSLAYTTVLGLKPNLSAVESKPTVMQDTESIESPPSGDDDNSSESSGGQTSSNTHILEQSRPKDETVDAKRERKKAVKEAKADRRKDKMPKHVKKRKVKMGKAHLK